jgi:tRNA (cytidine/uridine-2'-O-)-methyltransferase
VFTPKLNKNPLHNNNRHLERHIVLVAPEIHWNTGNIGRTCLATGTYLHIIKPLGFSLDSREVQRAGLDYWDRVKLTLWEDFNAFELEMAPKEDEIAVFSKKGAAPFWSMPSPVRLFLIFGSETKGLPEEILNKYADATFYIPITTDTRSLNLSTAAGIALYESLRLAEPFHGWPQEK